MNRWIIFGYFILNCVMGLQAQELGRASFYADKFQGRLTASGEVFDQGKMTAAHRTMAFGTRVKVTNLQNGRTVEVEINDRGPFVQGRIIDLSRAAAEKLDMIGAGTVPVQVDRIPRTAEEPLAWTPPPLASTDFSKPSGAASFSGVAPTPVSTPAAGNTTHQPPKPGAPASSASSNSTPEIFFQTGSFQDKAKAQTAAKKLARLKPQILLAGGLYRVGVPGLKKDQETLKKALKDLGIPDPLLRSSVPQGQRVAY